MIKNKKLTVKAFALILSVFLGINAQTSVWNGTAVDTTWFNTSATSFDITTAAQLAGLARMVNNGTHSFASRTINLRSNIVLNDTNAMGGWRNWDENTTSLNLWTPIGSAALPSHSHTNQHAFRNFSGTFNGNGFTVSGLFSVQRGGEWEMRYQGGLFGFSENATFLNLNVSGGFVYAFKCAAMLSGGGGRISVRNVSVLGRVIASDAGLLLGMINNTNVMNAAANGFVGRSDNVSVGGLIGYMTASNVSNSYANAEVRGHGGVDWGVGGFIGTLNRGGTVAIQNSYSAGRVIASATRARGGFIGSGVESGTDGQQIDPLSLPTSILFLFNNAYDVTRNPFGATFSATVSPGIRPKTTTEMRSASFGTLLPADPFNLPNPLDLSLNFASMSISNAFRWRLEASQNEGYPIFDRRPVSLEITTPTFEPLTFGYASLPAGRQVTLRNTGELPILIDYNNIRIQNAVIVLNGEEIPERDNNGAVLPSVFMLTAPPLASPYIGAGMSINFTIRPIRFGLFPGTYTASVTMHYRANPSLPQSVQGSVSLTVNRAAGGLQPEILIRDRRHGQNIPYLRAESDWQRFEAGQNVVVTKTEVEGVFRSGLEHTVTYEGINNTRYGPSETVPTEPGNYMVKAYFPRIFGSGFDFEPSVATSTFTIFREIARPSSRQYVYTSQAITHAASNDLYTVLEGGEGINAADYTAVLILNNPLFDRWQGLAANQTQINVEWQILQRALALPRANTGLVYDSNDKIGVDENPAYTLKNHIARDAGTYTAEARINDLTNYRWTSGDIMSPVRTVSWQIARAPIPYPLANTGLIYDGSPKTGVDEQTGFELENHIATNVGIYTATATLNPNYIWTDGSTEPLQINFEIIAPAKKEGTGEVYLEDWIEGMTASRPVISSATNGTGGVIFEYLGIAGTNYPLSQTQPTAMGVYRITAVFPANSEYYEARAHHSFQILCPTTMLDGTGNISAPGWTYGDKPLTPLIESETNDASRAVISWNCLRTGETLNEIPTNAGFYRVTAVIPASRNHREVTLTALKEILKARPEFTPPSFFAYVGYTLSMLKLPENWTWAADEQRLVGEEGLRKHPARFTPNDTLNYLTMTQDLDVLVMREFKLDFFLAENPITDDLHMEFIAICSDDADVNVKVFNAVGNMLFNGNFSVKRDKIGRLLWDMRNPAGRIIAPDVYLVIAQATTLDGKHTAVKRLHAAKGSGAAGRRIRR